LAAGGLDIGAEVLSHGVMDLVLSENLIAQNRNDLLF